MKIAFICGPFRAKDNTHGYNCYEQRRNIERARDVSLKVDKIQGWFAYCPHMNTADFQGAHHDAKWLEGNLEMLGRCDAVVLVDGWQQSGGSLAEVKFATLRKIPCFTQNEISRLWDMQS